MHPCRRQALDVKEPKKKLRSSMGPEEWPRGTCLRFKYTPPRGKIIPVIIGRVEGYEWRPDGKILVRTFTGGATVRYGRVSMVDVEQVDESLVEATGTMTGIKETERNIANTQRIVAKLKAKIYEMDDSKKKDNTEKELLALESLLDNYKEEKNAAIKSSSKSTKRELTVRAADGAQECFGQMVTAMQTLQGHFDNVKDVAEAALGE